MPDEKSKQGQRSQEPKGSSSAAEAPASNKPVASSSDGGMDAKEFQKSINDALQNYMRSLQDMYGQGMKRAEELYHEFLKAQKEQQVIVEENLKEDYRSFVSAMQQVWGQENAQSKMEEANRNFMVAVNDRQSEARKNLEELYNNYQDTLQKHTSETQANYATGYREMLKALQTAWTNADVASFDANTLASTGQLMIAASSCAGQMMAVK